MGDETSVAFWDRHFVTLESDAKRTLIPAIRDSHVFTMLCPGNQPDVKIAVELGVAIFLDKPILVIVPPNRFPSAQLTRVASKIVYVGNNPRTWRATVERAVEELDPS